MAEIKRRMRWLADDVWEFLVEIDALGMKPASRHRVVGFAVADLDPFSLISPSGGSKRRISQARGQRRPSKATVQPRQYEFLQDADKLTAFNEWLKTRMEASWQGPWIGKYIESAYKRGLLNSYLAAKKGELAIVTDVVGAQNQAQFLRTAFGQPERVSKVRLLATRSFEQMKGVTAQMGSDMNRILAQGMIDGKGVVSVAKEMTQSIDGLTNKRAMAIARSETVAAHASGQLDAFEDLGVDELGVKAEWSTAGAGVCPECSDMEGKTFTTEEASGMIPLHPNCVTGEMRILSPNPLSILRGHYTGKIFEILTSFGRRLSITENHVLLTQRGWVRTIELTDADYLVDASSFNRQIFERPYDDLGIPSIKDCFASSMESTKERFARCSHTPAPEDFHNDGKFFDSKIDIVKVDSHLWDQIQTAISDSEKRFLMGRAVTVAETLGLNSEGNLSAMLIRMAAASDCIMGFHGVEAVFFRGSFAHECPIGFSLPFDFDASRQQSFLDDPSFNTKAFLERQKRNPGLMELDHLIKEFWRDFNMGVPIRLASAPNPHPSLNKSNSDEVIVQPKNVLDFNCGETRLVEFDGLVFDKIKTVGFKHVESIEVFDVETEETAYLLEGVVSSNCRCSWIPALP